ncbi:Protein MAIN-LIKE 2 [Linum grandiflorum]
MYHGEVSITLQDIAHLTGLSVSGDALYVEYEKETNWAAIVQEVLGKSPVGHMKDGYACAYMLSSIRAFLMSGRSSAYVHCQYLLAFRERRPFAWGAAVLSSMYRELGRVVFKIEGGPMSTSAGDIGGWMVLLQAWCLERFPSIARRMHERGLRRLQSRIPPLIARLVSFSISRAIPIRKHTLLIFQHNCVDGRTGTTMGVGRHLSASSGCCLTRGLDFR